MGRRDRARRAARRAGTRFEITRPSDGRGGRGVLSLYLLRHGETEFSRGDRFCGDIDAPLTAAGSRMGELFANAYGGVRWRAIVTSTRRRTIATAAPLAARIAQRIQRDARLDEMFFGDWQGLTKREAAARDPVRYGRWRQDPTIGAPSGESPFEVSARAVAAIDDLRARYDSGNVLIVSHKTVLRLLFCRLLNIDLHRYRDYVDWPTGALSLLELGPCHAVARLIADSRHLFLTRNPQKGSEPPAMGSDGQSPSTPHALLPEARRHLVGEQLSGRGQPEMELVDDEPAGGDGARDLGLAADQGIDAVTGAMGGAADPVGGA
jgi:broad specificity phosphatase PhoE